MIVKKDLQNHMANKITPYFTSCKRFHLFKEAFVSFWDCCLDKDMIESFIVIDDNSSIEDRNEIMKLISQIPIPNLFISKNNIKSLASSLNIVYDICKTKYAMSLEDDWKFIKSGHFIKDAIEIIENHSHVKRVCVDFSSSGLRMESVDSSDIYSINNEKYFIHEYHDKNSWPSFTVRECVIDIESCFKNVGYFSLKPSLSHDQSPPNAETDYAVRYCNAGYRTAFFLDSYVKETSAGIASSFTLNNVTR